VYYSTKCFILYFSSSSNAGKYRPLTRALLRASYPRALQLPDSSEVPTQKVSGSNSQQMATGDVLTNTMRSSFDSLPRSSKPTFAQTLRRKSALIARKYNMRDEPAPRNRSYLNSTYDLEPYMNLEPSYPHDIDDDTPPSYLRYTPARPSEIRQRVADVVPLTQRLFCNSDITHATDYRKIESAPRLAYEGGLERGLEACHVSSSPNVSSTSRDRPTPSPCLYLKSHPSPRRVTMPEQSAPRPRGESNVTSTCTARELTRIITEPSGGDYALPFEPYNEVYPGVYIGDM
jgi:hypothetical protein